MAKLLIRYRADVLSTAMGSTESQFAALSHNYDLAAKLFQRGALLQMLFSVIGGRWPIEGAAEHGQLDMICEALGHGLEDKDTSIRPGMYAGHESMKLLPMRNEMSADRRQLCHEPDYGIWGTVQLAASITTRQTIGEEGLLPAIKCSVLFSKRGREVEADRIEVVRATGRLGGA
ncbi:hypothetical protein GGR58DRAFT_506187 [Xylaria digitata]|nr:hypothetical protein GGR58DRAFT_506187 [Xylaria digitata]